MIAYILIYKKDGKEITEKNITWEDACIRVAELNLLDYVICGVMKARGSYNLLEEENDY